MLESFNFWKWRVFSWRWWLGIKSKTVSVRSRDYEVTVIIPAYNEEASIEKTIRSIKSQTIPIKEILVVDDCSSDKTGEIAKKLGATVVRTEKNQGTKARAQQYIIERGFIKTELVVTIDGDTILDRRAIEKTLPYFNDPLTASVCGFVIPAKIKTVWERGRFIEYVFGISLFKAAQNNSGAVLVSSGCFSVFRFDLIKEAGGFKERTMAEDMDLTWEFGINGYHIYCAQDAICYPYDPPTYKIFVSQIDRWYRSFFQNISVHKKDLWKNKKLAAFIFGYLLESLISPIIMMLVLFVLTENIWQMLVLFFVMDMLVVSFFCLLKGATSGMFWKIFISLPSYAIIKPVNFAIFWRSFWKEWIKREPLAVWNKGH